MCWSVLQPGNPAPRVKRGTGGTAGGNRNVPPVSLFLPPANEVSERACDYLRSHSREKRSNHVG